MPQIAPLLTTLTSMARHMPTIAASGLLSTEGKPLAALSTPATMARYRFTTAREVEQAARVCPDRIALIDDDGSLTYQELRDNSRALARYFYQLNSKDLRIGVMARNGRGSIYPLTAKGYAGASIYLLNIGSSREQLDGCIRRDGINLLVIDEEFLPRLPEDIQIPVIVAHREAEPHPRAAECLDLEEIVATHTSGTLPVFPQHGAIVLMSSGTTGIPKGVMRNEPKAPTILGAVLSEIPFRTNMNVQLTASVFHTWGWGILNLSFAMRCTVITRRIFDPERTLRDVERFKIHAMISSPIFLKRFFEVEGQEDIDCSSLEFIFSSGHALSPWLVDAVHNRFGKILCNLYGSTEISAAAIANMEEVAQNPTVAGKICEGTTVRILDDNDQPVPAGTVGRIFCYNNTTLNGYTDPRIPIKRIGELIQIGDRGYLDERGLLYVLGRTDDMIIVGGENVFPRSVEEVLEPMPGIQDLYASGVDDDETFARIAVWIVKSPTAAGEALTEDAVRDWVRTKLADHSIPRDVHFIDELPRNATGKVMPRMLPGISQPTA